MSVTKRLLKELSAVQKDPNPALESLHPIHEDDLFHWEAVLKGPPDSPYDGEYINTPPWTSSTTDF